MLTAGEFSVLFEKQSDGIPVMARRSSLQTHVVEDDILRIWLEDGTRKVVSAKGKVLIDEAGKPYKITGTCQDITQEFLLNEKLKKSEATFRQVISNAPDAVIVIDDNGRIAIWNPVAEKIFGWKESEVVGRPLDQIIIPPGYRNLHLEDLERQRSGEAPHILGKTMEVSAINKKGEEFYIALSISRSDGPDNNSYISFIRDISREKQAEIELELKGSQLLQKNIELERSNQELLSFNYIASHDLQEPIRKIKIFSSRIMEKSQGKLPEGVGEIVQQVSANADYMQKLLDALLSYSRITTEGQVAEILDPNQVLEEVTQTLKDLIEEKKAVIIAEQLPKVRFVPVQFFQLVENLISNSLKYSKADTPPRILFHSISIPDREMPAFEGMVHGKDYHLISVTDNGIGFDQQFSEKVFELFQRLHGRNEYAGTGVGLAICRKIVQNHGGFITADSRPGEGTTMKIYLPVVQA